MMITAKKYAYLVDEYKAKLRMLWTILAGQQLDVSSVQLDGFQVKTDHYTITSLS